MEGYPSLFKEKEMKPHAWIIQNLSGYLAYLEPALTNVLKDYPAVERKEFIQWVVRRELTEIYCLYEMENFCFPYEYFKVYQALADSVDFNIQACFSHYFKAPHLFDSSNAIRIKFYPNDVVCVGYLTNQTKYVP